MEMKQISQHCYAVINEKNRVCDANSGLINIDGGVVVDTQSDLPHARKMIELFGKVWKGMPDRVINTHEDADHVWGNQLFEDAEIIAHSSVPERMKKVAEPKESQKLLHGVGGLLTRLALKVTHPGLLAAGEQLRQDYNFDGIDLILPNKVFDNRLVLNLDGTEVHLIHVGPCHQVGDTIIHVPSENVLFAGDTLFCKCTPMGWTGSYKKWFDCLDLMTELKPDVIVPGHGPICGLDGVREMRSYLEFVRTEAKKTFESGLSALQASKKIDLGPYAGWRAPARLYMNVERAYREFRSEALDAPWDSAGTFDAIYDVAKARGLEVEY